LVAASDALAPGIDISDEGDNPCVRPTARAGVRSRHDHAVRTAQNRRRAWAVRTA
jgi:hypothetical protein